MKTIYEAEATGISRGRIVARMCSETSYNAAARWVQEKARKGWSVTPVREVSYPETEEEINAAITEAYRKAGSETDRLKRAIFGE